MVKYIYNPSYVGWSHSDGGPGQKAQDTIWKITKAKKNGLGRGSNSRMFA
jgi:hypothetical protein